MRMESREPVAGYGWGLGAGGGLDGKTMHQMDKAWCGMQLFMTGDKDMDGMGAWYNEDWYREAWQDED
jgi:hypothetical protein